jgi:hypothetical protein
MARKYSRILSAAKYYASIDNYIKYITDASKRGSRIGTGKPRAKSKILFIDPFGVPMADGQVVPVSANDASWTTYKAKFTLRTKDAQSDEAKIINLANYTAARVIIHTGKSATGVAKTSAVTGMKYLSYGGSSTSIPFGRGSATDTESTAFQEIRLSILTTATNALISLKPEKF